MVQQQENREMLEVLNVLQTYGFEAHISYLIRVGVLGNNIKQILFDIGEHEDSLMRWLEREERYEDCLWLKHEIDGMKSRYNLF